MSRPRFEVHLVGLDEEGNFNGDDEFRVELGELSKTALKKTLRLVRDCPMANEEAGEQIARAEVWLGTRMFAVEGYEGDLNLYDVDEGEHCDGGGIDRVVQTILDRAGEEGESSGDPDLAPQGARAGPLQRVSHSRSDAAAPRALEPASGGGFSFGKLLFWVGFLVVGLAALGHGLRYLEEHGGRTGRRGTKASRTGTPRPPRAVGAVLSELTDLEASSREKGPTSLLLAVPRLREDLARMPPDQRRAAAEDLERLEARSALWNRGSLEGARWEDL